MVYFPKKTAQKFKGPAAHPRHLYAHASIVPTKGVDHEFENQ